MASLSPSQKALRQRFEGGIALAAPLLDVVLGIGERISRIAEPTDHEYYPIRPGETDAALPGDGPAEQGVEIEGEAELESEPDQP